jgi:hypothetical protein
MRTVSLALALAAAAVALAQRPPQAPGRLAGIAAERFHEAAGFFVSGDSVAAERAARAGLAAAPGDPALEALLAAIQRRPPPQPPSGIGTDERRRPQPQDGENEDRGGRDEEESPPDEAPTPGDQPEQQGGSNAGPTASGARPQGAGPEAATADGRPRMTREEAEALLRALGADERRLLRARAGQVEPREVENEW